MVSFRLGLRSPHLALFALLLGAWGSPFEMSRSARAGEGWAFSYPARPEETSPIDLRSMNEAEAGRTGFVRLSPDGNGFALGDGTPARFWAVNSEGFRGMKPAEMAEHARFLAGMGVNMVRLHAQIAPKGPGSRVTDFDAKEIDGIWRFVAEAKKQGIYLTISPYWASRQDVAKWGIEDYDAPAELWGLLFFDETLQKGYRAWATALYARTNPYTGIPLAKDPAVAIIQVQNEDSLLFWTNMTIRPPQKARLVALFARWLVAKHGSLAASLKTWGGASATGDQPDAGRVGWLDTYQLTIPQSGGMARRVADQVAFLAETQRRFYEETIRFYREELGCGSLINACNWRTASQALLDDAERWTYQAGDVIAVNRYFNGGDHIGPNNGWRIDPGDKFSEHSAVSRPRELPITLRQVVGRPMIVTESGWVNPLGFQSEGPFLSAVYLSLTGVDALYWFSTSQVHYDLDPFFPYQKVRDQKPLMKWGIASPPILGGFPAAALMFRKGYIRQAEPAVHEERTLKSLWDREPPQVVEDPAYDPNRDRNRPATSGSNARSPLVDPLAFLVGPVEVRFGGDPSRTRVGDLSKWVDRTRKVVRGSTGEVALDYGIGLCTLDAPRAQGACGSLSKAGPIALKDLTIRSKNSYATVVAVAMDDRPLAQSRRVLVQVGTSARPAGWSTRPVEFAGEGKRPTRGLEVVSTGKPPWMVSETEVGLEVRNPGLTRATRLDPAGFPAEDVPLKKASAGVTLELPRSTMYLILEGAAEGSTRAARPK